MSSKLSGSGCSYVAHWNCCYPLLYYYSFVVVFIFVLFWYSWHTMPSWPRIITRKPGGWSCNQFFVYENMRNSTNCIGGEKYCYYFCTVSSYLTPPPLCLLFAIFPHCLMRTVGFLFSISPSIHSQKMYFGVVRFFFTVFWIPHIHILLFDSRKDRQIT